jgi:uncharacterized protein YPO0396
MSQSKETSEGITAVLAQLASTSAHVQTLLRDLRESNSAQAGLKAELKSLGRNVTTLSSIIRDGGDGRQSLVTEVHVLQIADAHHEKRLTEVAEGFEAQIESVSAHFSRQFRELKAGLEKAETDRRADETAKIKLELEDRKDLRLDKRSRLATWVSVVLAILALGGTVVTYLITRGGN